MSDYLEFVVPCKCCEERWCLLHGEHWADCSCPGPHDDEEETEEAPSFTPTSSLIRCERCGLLTDPAQVEAGLCGACAPYR